MKFLSTVAVAALALSAANLARAADAVADFSATSQSGAWAYGEGVGGSSFTPFTIQVTDTIGTGFAGWQGANPQLLVPLIGLNQSGSTLNFGTVVDPTNVLLVHPGQGDGRDAIVQWTASTAGSYTIAGAFELLDTNPSGVTVSVYDNGTSVYTTTLTGPGAEHPDTPGQSAAFNATLALAVGDKIQFVVNNNGNFFNDSTGLSATISATPEPATWALMMVGVGGMGAALRTRRRKAVAAA